MAFFGSSTDNEQLTTQTPQQAQITQELMAQVMKAIQGFRPNTQNSVAGPTGAQQNLFSAVDQGAAKMAQAGGPQTRAQRQQSAPQAGARPTGRAALAKGPPEQTNPKDDLLQSLNSAIGKLIKNPQF